MPILHQGCRVERDANLLQRITKKQQHPLLKATGPLPFILEEELICCGLRVACCSQDRLHGSNKMIIDPVHC